MFVTLSSIFADLIPLVIYNINTFTDVFLGTPAHFSVMQKPSVCSVCVEHIWLQPIALVSPIVPINNSDDGEEYVPKCVKVS